MVPAAASLPSGIEAVVFVTSEEEASACRSLLSKLGQANVQVITLKPPSWLRFVGKLNTKWADLKVPILISHRKRFRSLSALVVAERTSTLLKRLRSEERRVGKACVGPCKSRWWRYNSQKN